MKHFPLLFTFVLLISQTAFISSAFSDSQISIIRTLGHSYDSKTRVIALYCKTDKKNNDSKDECQVIESESGVMLSSKKISKEKAKLWLDQDFLKLKPYSSEAKSEKESKLNWRVTYQGKTIRGGAENKSLASILLPIETRMMMELSN